MSGLVRRTTTTYNFKIINYDFPRWHTAEWENWDALDAILNAAGVISVSGIWANNTAYTVGMRLIDIDQGTIWGCLVDHTSAVSGTFEDDRIANPSYWVAINAVPNFRGAWVTATLYNFADIVVVDTYKYYYCVATHISSAAFATDSANWVLLFDATAAANAGAVRFDVVQGLTSPEKTQGRANTDGAHLNGIMRNRLINGCMRVSQLNGLNVGTVSPYYSADLFLTVMTAATAAFSAQNVVSGTPGGAITRLRFTVTTAKAVLAAGDSAAFLTVIEGTEMADLRWGVVGAKQVLLRFMFRGPAGTYGINIRNGTTARTYIATFTIAPGQANTDTIQQIVIPGDVTGTWSFGNDVGMYIGFNIAAGTTHHGVAGWQAGNLLSTSAQFNGLGTIGNVFELSEVALYADYGGYGIFPVWQHDDYSETLRRCKRYWEMQGAILQTTALEQTLDWEVEKRTSPIISVVPSTGSGGVFVANGVVPTKQAVQSVVHSTVTSAAVVGDARMV